jgi:peptidyl-prolyl cis-trans isomerase D
MMRDLREKTKWVMIIVALAFVGLMVFEWGMDATGMGSLTDRSGALGRVNGQTISYEEYQRAYQQLYQQAQQRAGGQQISREQIRQLEDAAFEEVVRNTLMRQEMRRRGIRVTDAEIRLAAQWMPHPELMQNEIFLTDGQFDINKYQQFLTGPAASQQLLLELEDYYRAVIPQSKLMRQVTAGLHVSDSDLWQMWRDENETATVDYVTLNISQLVPGDMPVTEREIRAYYDANRDDFRRPARVRVNLASISKLPTAADSAAALERARAARAEIVGGAGFAEVAERESADVGSAAQGGDLGYFGRGQMVPQFEEAAFSLPIGQLSEPVLSPFGYHLIEVQEREEDRARARHILIEVEPTEGSLDRLYARADSLEDLAVRAGVERAARLTEGQYREGVVISADQPYIPGVGSAYEAIQWARDEQDEDDPLDVSPVFETAEAFYLVELDAYAGPGTIPLSEATPEIRRRLILQKKQEEARRIGQEMVAQVRGGRSLDEVARERGLEVQSAGPFSRVGFNPAFGQANAATGAAFGVPVNQVSDVVGTPGGLFIIRPTDRTRADREEFEEQKEQLRQFVLFQMQQEAVNRWLQNLRQEANVTDRRDEVLQRV